MALHTELPIYRTGVRLLDLAVRAQVQDDTRWVSFKGRSGGLACFNLSELAVAA